uniref:two-component regulator propeller domain-containing protein n=1 Tax=Capnocytophaga canis TaxID=1848903 RepID=UPI001561BAC8
MKTFIKICALLVGMCYIHGQELPICESNTFIYNKYNFGDDFINAIRPIHINSEGSVYLAPYGKKLKRLESNTVSTISDKFDGNYEYSGIIEKDGVTYFFFEKSIYSQRGEKIERLPFDVEEDFLISHVVEHEKHIYFTVIHITQRNKIRLYVYDIENKQFKNIKTEFNNLNRLISNDKTIYFIVSEEGKTFIYDVIDNFKLVKTYPFITSAIGYIISPDDFYFENSNTILYHYKDGVSTPVFEGIMSDHYLKNKFYGEQKKEAYRIYDLSQTPPQLMAVSSDIKLRYLNSYSPESHSFYVSTPQHLGRLFPYIKKYPRIFDGDNSESIHSITQSPDGKIWVGSYGNNFSVIDDRKIVQSKQRKRILPGAMSVGNKMLVYVDAPAQTFLYENENKYTILNDTVGGYFSFVSSKGMFFTGTFNYGLMYKPLKDLENKSVKWKFVGKDKGMKLQSCLTVAEDKFGNIWTGAGGQLAVFQEDKNQAISLYAKEKDIPFGSIAMLKDTYDTLWFGTSQGELFYWNGKHKDDFRFESFVRIEHPLLVKGKMITFIHQWNDWLVLGAKDKVLLFNIATWHKDRKVLVRYLNPMECKIESVTEQNTVLTDFRDQSLWFATSDMLYQWDIEKWLKLPTFHVTPRVQLHEGESSIDLKTDEALKISPSKTSFEIQVTYQGKDNMPRYMRSHLVKKGETPKIEDIAIQKNYNFQNLSPGQYIFQVLICQQDGSYSVHEYPITITKFIWQQWWFWFLLLLFPTLIVIKQVRIQQRMERQQKEITQLNMLSLGKQFRPHFMLNVLNSLGASLYDKPHAERIISRIGENINIIHLFSKENQPCISFAQEWKLALNTIDIYKELYVKELHIKISHVEVVPLDYRLPIGTLQMVVENALLHGVRHRKVAPFLLEIDFTEDDFFYYITISDNGVGMEHSKKFYEFARRGTGLNNIAAMIEIINTKIERAFSIRIKKNNPDDQEYPGTIVSIRMRKDMNFKNIFGGGGGGGG